MKVENKVRPNEEQMQGFTKGDVDTPIYYWFMERSWQILPPFVS